MGHMVYRLGFRMRKPRTTKPGHSLVAIALAAITLFTSVTSAQKMFAPQINVWWPNANARISGVQPIRADLVGQPVERYHMYWSVDGGQQNIMPTSYEHAPHKETTVDVTNWTWRGNGPYTLTYIATNTGGKEITRTDVTVFVDHGTLPVTQPNPTPTAAPAPVQPVPAPTTTQATTTPTPIATSATLSSLYVSPDNNSARQASAWKTSRPADAAVMERVAGQAQSKWFGGWNQNVESDVRTLSQAAQAKGGTPVMVAYNIPQRDCGHYSAGGSSSADAYRSWIGSFARGLGSAPAIVILEPDAVAGMDCLNAADRTTRLQLLSEAVTTLKKQSGTKVYLDGGHARWHSPGETATRLTSANIADADGFSLNVSNFFTTEENTRYGTEVANKLQGKHFVIDTSRNGAGPTADQQWCNPSDRALGASPTTQTNNALIDAFLWIKAPGESDGSCNGAPSAGVWWPDYALNLAKKAGW